jgi:hypothetical protein
VAQDLLDAIVSTLENNAAFTAAFGDTWNQAAQTGTAKVFADFADQFALPYAVLTETGETYEYMTHVSGGAVNFISPGQLQCDIWAAGRFQTRTLGWVVAKALNDASLVWPLENEMHFRLVRSLFAPMPGQSGAGVPIVFHRVFYFEYTYSGVM